MPRGPKVVVSSEASVARLFGAGILILGALVLFSSPGAFAQQDSLSGAASILTGVTRGPAGKALPGVEIRVFLPGSGGKETFLITRSDLKGRFSLALTAPGFYQYVAVKGGYAVLVGQFNTLVQKTLDLVLKPSGPPGPPGTRPQDEGWVLRLPSRDLLEERSFEPIPAAETPARPPQYPLLLEIGAGQLNEGDQDSRGLRAFLGGRFTSPSWGKFALAFQHRGEGDSPEFREQAQELSTRWWSSGEVSRSYLALAASRQERARSAGGTLPLNYRSRSAAVRGVYSHWIPGDRWSGTLRLEGASLDTNQRTGAQGSLNLDDFSAPAFSAGLLLQRHQDGGDLILESRLWTVNQTSPDEGETILAPLAAAEGLNGLGAMGSSGVWFGAAYRHEAGEDLALLARGRAENVNGPWGGTRGAVAAGVEWRWTEMVLLTSEAGVAGGSEKDGLGIYSLALRRDGPSWHWSVRRSRESGPWTGEGLGTAGFLLVTDREATLDRWEAQVRWEPEGNGPRFGLRGETYKASGTLTSNIPGDLILVPVIGEGAGRGVAVALDIGLPGTGTWIQAVWDRLEDDSGSGLVPGTGGAWTRRQMLLRQRLLSRERALANCDLIIGYERAELTDPRPADSGDPLRLELLDRERFSGGLAVSF